MNAYVNASIFLEDGTKIDENEIMLACENGTMFTFIPEGEQWNPSVLSADNTYINVFSGENLVQQNTSLSECSLPHSL